MSLEDELYAVEDGCPHEVFVLSAGPLEGGTIECVLHGARFDLKTGEALCAPAYLPVRTFPVVVEDGAVWTRDDR